MIYAKGSQVVSGHLELRNDQERVTLELPKGFKIAWQPTTSDFMWLATRGKLEDFDF